MLELGRFYKAKPYFALLRDTVGLVPSTNSYVAAQRSKAMKGKCVFVHPRGRFVTLEFPFRGALSGNASGRMNCYE